jgi:CheY-like chemotaxis protein
MGGDLRLLDRPSPGASFELTLPLKICSPSEPAQSGPLESESLAVQVEALSLLVIEDNAMNRAVLQALLEPTGWRLAFAENGALGLQVLSTDRFDVVLMDIHMPVMDGLQAIAEIRAGKAAPSDVPVIALTADAMTGSRENLLAAGFNGYVEKPIRPQALLDAIHAALPPAARRTPESQRLIA